MYRKMTNKEFKKVGRLLKELYKELEAEAIPAGVDIFGDEYQRMQAVIRLKLLSKMGYTLEEYIEARDRTVNEQRANRKQEMNDVYRNIVEVERKAEDKLTDKEVLDLIEKNQKPPQVTEKTVNKIVKEVVKEKPTIVKETKTVIEREEFDDRYLLAEIGSLNERLENLPTPKEVDEDVLMEKVTNLFGELFEHNIDTLGMPHFRKLAMGLQGQIDTKVEGVGINRLFVSDTAPTDPVAGDVWIDTAAYTYQDITTTYTLTDTDYLINCSGTFTVTLPTAVSFTGEYIIKNGGTGMITVVTTSSQTIDGETTQYVDRHDSMVVRSTGTNWIIV